MKKKIVSALLCVAMIATMATGCGGSKSSSIMNCMKQITCTCVGLCVYLIQNICA